MSDAKNLEIKVIDSKSSRQIVERYHYSGKCTQNSQIHFGVFLAGKLEGALQFGPSIDKRRMGQNLGIGMNEFLELNRMALSPLCPKNSESRSLGICLRILRKRYPHLKLIISFADACQSGDGTIYRASGFKLHSFKKNNSLLSNEAGDIIADKTLNDIYLPNGKQLGSFLKGKDVIAKKSMDDIILSNRKYLSTYLKGIYKPIVGYQMKYIYFFDKALESKFKFVEFKDIPDNVRMYLGKRASSKENVASDFRSEEGGVIPTDALQLKEPTNG